MTGYPEHWLNELTTKLKQRDELDQEINIIREKLGLSKPAKKPEGKAYKYTQIPAWVRKSPKVLWTVFLKPEDKDTEKRLISVVRNTAKNLAKGSIYMKTQPYNKGKSLYYLFREDWLSGEFIELLKADASIGSKLRPTAIECPRAERMDDLGWLPAGKAQHAIYNTTLDKRVISVPTYTFGIFLSGWSDKTTDRFVIKLPGEAKRYSKPLILWVIENLDECIKVWNTQRSHIPGWKKI